MQYHILTFTPKQFQRYQCSYKNEEYYYRTRAGIMRIAICNNGIYQALFCNEFIPNNAEYITYNISTLILVGTPFQIKVWQALIDIPHGTTISYQELAQAIKAPTSWRAVANAVAKNNIAYFVPCHRIIRSNGMLGGYRWGINKKQFLLSKENAL